MSRTHRIPGEPTKRVHTTLTAEERERLRTLRIRWRLPSDSDTIRKALEDAFNRLPSQRG